MHGTLQDKIQTMRYYLVLSDECPERSVIFFTMPSLAGVEKGHHLGQRRQAGLTAELAAVEGAHR